MAQFFNRTANTVARFTLWGFAAAVGLVMLGGFWIVRSPYENREDEPREQPVPFSHEHHAGDLGIDCRYCHTTVEKSSFANIPATKICMNCHSQMWATSAMLEPVRESWRTGRSIAWTRVYDLPEFVYFNHSVHVDKGIGCSECHGRVDKMPLTWRAVPLEMQWCLECHRNPEMRVRPQSEVFNVAYVRPRNQAEMGRRLVQEYHIQSLTSCSNCHR